MKRILSFIFVFAMILGMIPFGVSAAEQTLEDEIKNTVIGGKLFDEDDYPAQAGAAAKIFGFSEVGYTYSGDFSKFGMYVYVYNPSQKTVKESGNHQALMAVKFDEAGNALEWEEFSMNFVEKTDDDLFLKFKIVDHESSVDGKKIVTRVKRDARRYSVAEIEVHYEGMTKATNVTVGQSYVFTGFSADNDLSLRTYKFETLELNVKPTIFRSASSSKGEGYQNQLNSVYFAVPNSVTDQYGYLAAIHASWNEQKTQPIVVCDNIDVVNTLAGDYTLVGQSNYIGADIGKGSESILYGFAYSTDAGFYHVYNGANMWLGLIPVVNSRINCLAYMFYDEEIVDGEISVSAEDLIAHIEKYESDSFLFTDKVDSDRQKGNQTVDISIGDTFNFENFSGVRDWFVNIWNSISGGDVLKKEFENVAPIYKVTAADMAITDKDELAQQLLVDVNDVDAIREAYNQAMIGNESLWIFRFAVTDYYSHEINYWQQDSKMLSDTSGYCAEQTVFLDFNVIELTCEKEGVKTVIPVSSAKQDVVGDVTAPTPGIDPNDPDDLLAKIFAVLFVLIFLIVGAYLLPMFQRFVDWLFPKKRE